jgi:hypothetical protein
MIPLVSVVLALVAEAQLLQGEEREEEESVVLGRVHAIRILASATCTALWVQ